MMRPVKTPQTPVRAPRAASRRAGLLLPAVLAIACTHDPAPEGGDAAAAGDLAGAPDGAALADLGPPDLAGEPVSVTGLPQGCPTSVTAEQLYNEVVSRSCAVATGCHGEAPTAFGFASAAEMRTRWINKTSAQAGRMVRVKPGSIDQSYLMYKLMGQQEKPGGSGERMPPGSPTPLPNEDLCKFIGWIKDGAR
jgi:hypothetical protein